jgi:NAD/NADP transhydrogenase alpha subunit
MVGGFVVTDRMLEMFKGKSGGRANQSSGDKK